MDGAWSNGILHILCITIWFMHGGIYLFKGHESGRCILEESTGLQSSHVFG